MGSAPSGPARVGEVERELRRWAGLAAGSARAGSHPVSPASRDRPVRRRGQAELDARPVVRGRRCRGAGGGARRQAAFPALPKARLPTLVPARRDAGAAGALRLRSGGPVRRSRLRDARPRFAAGVRCLPALRLVQPHPAPRLPQGAGARAGWRAERAVLFRQARRVGLVPRQGPLPAVPAALLRQEALRGPGGAAAVRLPALLALQTAGEGVPAGRELRLHPAARRRAVDRLPAMVRPVRPAQNEAVAGRPRRPKAVRRALSKRQAPRSAEASPTS